VFCRYAIPISLAFVLGHANGQGRELNLRRTEAAELRAIYQETNSNLLLLLEDRDRFIADYADRIWLWVDRGLLPRDYIPPELESWHTD
jgi:hypothetical protein